jgi:nicotinate-nucleotide adenylyltransferase
MLRLAIEGLDGLELCTLESESGGVRYSIDTMRRLREGPPRRIPVFIMGMDSLLELPTWKDFRDLIREFDVIAVNRPEAGGPRAVEDPDVARAIVELAGSEAGMGVGGRIFVFRMPPVAVSSSGVRSRVASGGSLTGLVPPAVARYIHANGLYLQEERS